MIVTLSDLRALDACVVDVQKFSDIFGGTVEVTRDALCAAVAAHIDVDWWARKVWGDAYVEATAVAWRVYVAAEAESLRAFDAGTAGARRAYWVATDASWRARWSATIEPRRAYVSNTDPSWLAYEAATAEPLRVYKAAMAEARCAYVAECVDAIMHLIERGG